MQSENSRIVERFRATGTWGAESGVRVGGDAGFEQNVDMALVRDKSGQCYIPGSSIAGAVRSRLAALIASQKSSSRGFDAEPPELWALFGRKTYRSDSGPAYASLLTFRDAPAARSTPAFVRDGVRIEGPIGLADDRGKFNFEVLPAGTGFVVRIELVLYEKLPHDVGREDVMQYFRWVLEALASGAVSLGARTRRGLGRGTVREWSIRRFDMSQRSHVLDWLARSSDGGEVWTLERLGAQALEASQDRLVIDAELKLKTSLLIRAGGEDRNAPDMTHLSEGNHALLTGTSLGGALRHRAARIANTLWGGKVATELIESMFGPDAIKIGRTRQRDLHASRVWVTETALHDGSLNVQARVAIDRFTQGAFETALFDQAPYWPDRKASSHVSVHIEFDPGDEVDRREILLLLETFKDLWLGDLPLGGEVGAGRGVFTGVRAQIQFRDYPKLELHAPGNSAPQLSGWGGRWQEIVDEAATVEANRG